MYARWNLWRAMGWGACVGALVATFDLVGHGTCPKPPTSWARSLGGVIGGGILFGLASATRNWMLKV